VTKATGWELVIDGDLRFVPSLVHPRLRAERVTFENADWAKHSRGSSFGTSRSTAQGHGGPVLALRDTQEDYPLNGSAKIGATSVKLDGRITELLGLSGIDTSVTLSGKSMEDLYHIIGVAMDPVKIAPAASWWPRR
jgi:hypothetical protein